MRREAPQRYRRVGSWLNRCARGRGQRVTSIAASAPSRWKLPRASRSTFCCSTTRGRSRHPHHPAAVGSAALIRFADWPSPACDRHRFARGSSRARPVPAAAFAARPPGLRSPSCRTITWYGRLPTFLIYRGFGRSWPPQCCSRCRRAAGRMGVAGRIRGPGLLQVQCLLRCQIGASDQRGSEHSNLLLTGAREQ